MSLKLWLPLNGNTNNIGCSDYQVEGDLTYENGKLAKAGKFEYNHLLVPNFDLLKNNIDNYTFSIWYYVTKSNVTHGICSCRTQNIGLGFAIFLIRW